MMNTDQLHTLLLTITVIAMSVLCYRYLAMGGDGGAFDATLAALGAIVGATLTFNTKPPTGA